MHAHTHTHTRARTHTHTHAHTHTHFFFFFAPSFHRLRKKLKSCVLLWKPYSRGSKPSSLVLCKSQLLSLTTVVGKFVQSDLTYPHTSVLDEIVDKGRELDK